MKVAIHSGANFCGSFSSVKTFFVDGEPVGCLGNFLVLYNLAKGNCPRSCYPNQELLYPATGNLQDAFTQSIGFLQKAGHPERLQL